MTFTDLNLKRDKLVESLTYEPDTGLFRWIAKRRGLRIGDVAGSVSDQGYVCIRLNGKLYRAHRLAWLYMTGEMPGDEIDHEDGDRSNNKWNNLRRATRLMNRKNQGVRVDNTSGCNGVRWYETLGKWHAQIQHNYDKIHIGYFETLEEAVAARKEYELKLGFHANHGQRDSYVRSEAEKLVIKP